MQYLAVLSLTLGVVYVNQVIGQQGPCQISYYKLGCFQDRPWSRTMSEMLISDRDNTSSGETIDWNNWNYYMQGLACRCAQAASAKGYTTFGLQFYGECWSGSDSCDQYSRYGDSEYCIGQNYTRCDINDDTECMGQQSTNFVYLLLEEPEDEAPISKQ